MPVTAARRTSAPPFLVDDLVPEAYRFTVEQYHQLGDAGILTEEDRVELIDGWIREKPVQKSPHASTLTRLQKRLPRVIPESFEFRSQLPITLATSEPEPDAVVVRGPVGRYDDNHPRAREVALVVEVSDTSLEFDRGTKLLVYADARIPVYWIVNILDQSVEVYTGPRRGRNATYRARSDYARGARVPIILYGVAVGEIAVNDLLPG